MQRMNKQLERLENDDVVLTEKEIAELKKTAEVRTPIGGSSFLFMGH